MKDTIYHLDLESSINYSLSFRKNFAELTIYFRYGEPENIRYQYNTKEISCYEGYNESKGNKRNISMSELKTEFLQGLELFLEHIDKIKPKHEVTKNQNPKDRIETIINSIK